MLDSIFQTNELKVLIIMANARIPICGEMICPLKQNDIAVEMNMSRAVINNICNTLRKKGYLEMDAPTRWRLTHKAEKVINGIKAL